MKYWVRYVLACVMVVLVFVLLLVLGNGLGLGLMFLDLPSIGLVLFLTAPLLLINFSFKQGWISFRLAFSRNAMVEEKDIKNGILFFKQMGITFLLSGFVGFFVGIVMMMGNLEDKTAIGPNLAVALLSALYGVVFKMIIAVPLRFSLEKKLNEMEGR